MVTTGHMARRAAEEMGERVHLSEDTGPVGVQGLLDEMLVTIDSTPRIVVSFYGSYSKQRQHLLLLSSKHEQSDDPRGKHGPNRSYLCHSVFNNGLLGEY